ERRIYHCNTCDAAAKTNIKQQRSATATILHCMLIPPPPPLPSPPPGLRGFAALIPGYDT
ncbi:hypothetical protein BaRGS_00014359, partial [Batillaria attramentaria]